ALVLQLEEDARGPHGTEAALPLGVDRDPSPEVREARPPAAPRAHEPEGILRGLRVRDGDPGRSAAGAGSARPREGARGRPDRSPGFQTDRPLRAGLGW